jgi:hypothetical protein
MDFEYDRQKSEANKAKHGIDFDEAQALWQDPALIEIPARAMDEPRSLAIAQWAGHHWSAMFTRRSERIRRISVRRARVEEVKVYESEAI